MADAPRENGASAGRAKLTVCQRGSVWGRLVDITLWLAAIGGGALIVWAGLYLLPARTTITIDTAASAAQAEMKTLWGLGPTLYARALPKSNHGNPLEVFHDPARIGNALTTPGIADVSYRALHRLYQLKPRAARLELGLNLSDATQNLVVQTAAQAPLAAAPASMRSTISITKCPAPGADLVGRYELYASPMQLASIYGAFKRAEPVREFRRRLKRKAKPSKKAPGEIRTA